MLMQKKSSDRFHVTLTQLTLTSGGRYKCEVSADAPSFQTSYNTVEMAVIGKYHLQLFIKIIHYYYIN